MDRDCIRLQNATDFREAFDRVRSVFEDFVAEAEIERRIVER